MKTKTKESDNEKKNLVSRKNFKTTRENSIERKTKMFPEPPVKELHVL